MAHTGLRTLLLSLPTLRVGIPNTVAEQPIQIGKVWITVDEEVQAFAIVLTGPLAIPRLPPRIIRVEVRAPQRLPAAMRATFNVAARAMAFADGRAAIETCCEYLAHACCRTWMKRNCLRIYPKAQHGESGENAQIIWRDLHRLPPDGTQIVGLRHSNRKIHEFSKRFGRSRSSAKKYRLLHQEESVRCT